MSEMKTYKCPACGGTMEFDSASQKMKCSFCGTLLTVDELEKQLEKEGQQTSQTDQVTWQQASQTKWKQDEIADMKVYSCDSCGGEIIVSRTTGATACPFCGNKVVIKGQFEGGLKPDYIIPFKKDKKEAKAAYLKHLEDKKFLPDVFQAENHIDEIKGLYVPFWLFDIDASGEVRFEVTKRRSWTSGKHEFTEEKIYSSQRNGTISFEHIPADGSKRMDDTLMESIEPYRYKDVVPFQMGYFAGYMADRYDVDIETRKSRMEERTKKSVEESFADTITGADSIKVKESHVELKNAKYWYAFFPVWILSTTWRGKNYIFAMNGQTGKIVGDLPMDKGKYVKHLATSAVLYSLLVFAIIFVALLFI